MEVLDKGRNGRQVVGAEGVQGRLCRHVGRICWIRREVGQIRVERDTLEFGVRFLLPSCEERFIIFVINDDRLLYEQDFAIFITKDANN